MRYSRAMIRSLTGTITDKTELSVVLDVRGVGYLIYTPMSTTLKVGNTATLNTYLAVRETALDLYGFSKTEELELFERLLTLPKIGPKSALQILSQATIELINSAVINNDASQLSKMSGIGKKTAEKVVAGLTDIYEKEGVLADLGAPTGDTSDGQGLSDTIDALVALGYAESAARKAVLEVKDTKPELKNTNDIIKEALRQLS